MDNPGRGLAKVFARWEEFHDVDGFRDVEHREETLMKGDAADALALIEAIKQITESRAVAGIDIGIDHEVIEDWQNLCFDHASNRATPAQARAARLLATAVAASIERYIPDFTDAEREDLRSIADEFINGLDESTDLPEEMRVHLFEVASHVRHVLDNWHLFGAFELRRAVEQLTGALISTIPRQADSQRDWIKNAAGTFSRWLARRAAYGADSMIDEFIQNAITSGP